MANLQSQIDILAKAIVNEHVRVDDAVVSIRGNSEGTFALNHMVDAADKPNIQGFNGNGTTLMYSNHTSQYVNHFYERVGLYEEDVKDDEDPNLPKTRLLSIYDPDNSFDLIGLSVENLNESKDPESTNTIVTRNEYFIDANGKITKVDSISNNKINLIQKAVNTIKSAEGILNPDEKIDTHINTTRDYSNGTKHRVYAINRIGFTHNCHGNNVLIEREKTFENNETGN